MKLRSLLGALLCVAALGLCGFIPNEADIAALSSEQKAFVCAPDWNETSKQILTTVKTGIKNNAGRAIVIAGCLYEDMPAPRWLSEPTNRDKMIRRMYANALLAVAMDAQVKAQSGRSILGKDFLELMEGIRGKTMNGLKADTKQAGIIEDMVSRHLLETMKNSK